MKLSPSEKMSQYFQLVGSEAPDIRKITEYYWEILNVLLQYLPENDQKLESVKGLLHSKDCALRSLVDKYPPQPREF